MWRGELEMNAQQRLPSGMYYGMNIKLNSLMTNLLHSEDGCRRWFKIPESGFSRNFIFGEEFHPIQFGLGILLSGGLATYNHEEAYLQTSDKVTVRRKVCK